MSINKLGVRSYEFGKFRLVPEEHLLLCNGAPVPLSPKVFDVLVCLVEHEGHLIKKNDLLDRFWADSFVEEATLARTVSTLRKALGETEKEKFIETVAKSGYRFIAPVRLVTEDEILSSPLLLDRESETAKLDSAPVKINAVSDFPAETVPPGKRVFSRPVLLIGSLCIASLIVAILISWNRQANSTGEIRSIAVLPFIQIGDGARDTILEFGMADTLITQLSKLKRVVVRPTSSVTKYSGQKPDAIQAGRDLRVDAVLEGTIQQTGEHVRLNLQLISTADGSQLWAEQFDTRLADVFAVQDSISDQVVSALKIQLSREERDLAAKRPTVNPEAYKLYVQGRFLWNKRTAEERRKAIDYFSRAIALDSNYALAYAGLADCYVLGGHGMGAPVSELMAKAKDAATTALEIDNSLAEAHTSLALVNLTYDWDFEGAASSFRRALELNPNYAVAHHWYSEYLIVMRRHEDAMEELKRAQELDPTSLIISRDIGRAFYYSRKYDEAIAEYRRTLEMDAEFLPAVFYLGLAYTQKGMFPEAVAELEKADALARGSASTKAALVYVYAKSGETDKARGLFNELIRTPRQNPVPSFEIAVANLGLGQKDAAFELLQKACSERSYRLIHLQNDPPFDDLRSDPRFTSVLQCVGLAQ